jgi:O-antigen/teichoic acid export membrane protein
MTDLYMLIGCGLLGAVAVVGRPLMEMLVGPGYWEGYVVLLPAMAGVVVYGASVLGQKTIELVERTYIMVVGALLAALINMVLNFLFVPIYGYIAAAYVTFISYTAYAGVILWKSRSDVHWDIPWFKISATAICATISSILSWNIIELCEYSQISRIIYGSIIFIFLYAISIVLLRYQDMRSYLLIIKR